MMILYLRRLSQTAFATYGHLTDPENKQLCVTLERPWVDNKHDESCGPAGTFTANRFHSPHFNCDVFRLAGVPEREGIEMHVGNLPHDSEGCILLGTAFGTINGQHGITGSKIAFKSFMDSMRGIDSFMLTITDPEVTQ